MPTGSARGLPGEGHLLVFNNGSGRPGGNYSSVDEIVLPVDAQGQYTRRAASRLRTGARRSGATLRRRSRTSIAFFISGAQRLPNGNTLICSGANGTLFEVTPDKEVVWKYVNPVKGGFGPGRARRPARRRARSCRLFLQDTLDLSPEQKKQIEDFQKEVDGKLDKTLTDAQKKQLREINARPGPAGFGRMSGLAGPDHVEVDPDRLKPTAEQKTQLDDLQKEVDAKLDKLLTDDQKKQFKEMREDFARGGPLGPGGPGGPGGPRADGPPGCPVRRPAGRRRVALPRLSVRPGLSGARRQGSEAGQDD